jgi:hypothetical protein
MGWDLTLGLPEPPEPEVTPAGIVWADEPVPLTTFITDRRYLGNPPLGFEQYEAVRHAERIYFASAYAQLAESSERDIRDYWRQPCRPVNFLELEWGKGGGKDHICRIISQRIAYLLLCLPSPQEYYGMPEQDTIHTLNVASSSKQASRAFFAPMRRSVTRPGCWFQTHGVEVVEVTRQQRQQRQRDGDAARALQDTIRFPKNIESISGHSDAESQEGLNLILGIADEVDAFRRREELAKYHAGSERDSTRSAEGIIEMLRSSARTRFPEVFKNVYISYPRYLGSMIQTLVAAGVKDFETKGQSSKHYVSGPHATWEVNPRVQRHCVNHDRFTSGCELCWNRCKAAFQDDYDEDPIFARAKYECRPSRAINPYFANETAVRDVFKPVVAEPLTFGYVMDEFATSWRPVYANSPDLYPIVGAAYVLHADLAVNGDRAGVALAHVARWEDRPVLGHDETGTDVEIFEQRPVVKIDFAIAFSADKKQTPPREIQIRWARELALELIRQGYNLRLFTTDGFESVDSRQIMETQHGLETAVVSTDRASAVKPDGISSGEAIWKNLRDLIYEARILIPAWLAPPVTETRYFVPTTYDLAIGELLALSRMPNGKIDHPPGGSKDIADAIAGAAAGAVYLGGAEDAAGARAHPGVPLREWGGTEGDLEFPVGFIGPNLFRPDEVMRVPVGIDGMGRPLKPRLEGALDAGEVEPWHD